MEELIDQIPEKRNQGISDKEIALELLKLHTVYQPWLWGINRLQSVYIQLVKNIETLTYEDLGEIVEDDGCGLLVAKKYDIKE